MSDEMLEADYEEESDQSEFDTEQEYMEKRNSRIRSTKLRRWNTRQNSSR